MFNIDCIFIKMQAIMDWGSPWFTFWSHPIGPDVEGAMWKWVQYMTQRWTALLVGASLLNPFHLSSEERRPFGKIFHINFGCKIYVDQLQSLFYMLLRNAAHNDQSFPMNYNGIQFKHTIHKMFLYNLCVPRMNCLILGQWNIVMLS